MLSIIIRDNKCQLKIKTFDGTLKLFFDNYKDYYYLPAEDKAIHKSVSQFVDKEHRVQAKASTCYENIKDSFILCPGGMKIKYVFKDDYKSKDVYIRTSDLTDKNIESYINIVFKEII